MPRHGDGDVAHPVFLTTIAWHQRSGQEARCWPWASTVCSCACGLGSPDHWQAHPGNHVSDVLPYAGKALDGGVAADFAFAEALCDVSSAEAPLEAALPS